MRRLLFFAVFTMVMLSLNVSQAQLACPPMPDKITQVNHDVRSDVDLEIGSLGKLNAGKLGVQTDVVAKNLFDKYPNTDRVVIAQMMSATYCAMIRDSKALADSEKLRLWSEFSERVFRFENPDYKPAPAKPKPPKSGHNSTPDLPKDAYMPFTIRVFGTSVMPKFEVGQHPRADIDFENYGSANVKLTKFLRMYVTTSDTPYGRAPAADEHRMQEEIWGSFSADCQIDKKETVFETISPGKRYRTIDGPELTKRQADALTNQTGESRLFVLGTLTNGDQFYDLCVFSIGSSAIFFCDDHNGPREHSKQDQVSLMKDQFRLGQRPVIWLAPTDGNDPNEQYNPLLSFQQDGPKQRIMVNLGIRNLGKSPAYFERERRGIAVLPAKNMQMHEAPFSDVVPEGGVESETLDTDPLTEDQIKTVLNSDNGITIRVRYLYRDSLKNLYESDMCYSRLATSAWSICQPSRIIDCLQEACEMEESRKAN